MSIHIIRQLGKSKVCNLHLKNFSNQKLDLTAPKNKILGAGRIRRNELDNKKW